MDKIKLRSFYYFSVLVLLHVVHAAAFNITSIPFSKGFSPLFGDANIIPSGDDQSVQLQLNQYTGSGFKSSDLFGHGLYSAKIKLPSDYTAGIVIAFYTTNGDLFPKSHDELDFEFLGNVRGKPWRCQTNMYGNGSTSRGREERYYLWFDPSQDFHRYSILWTTKNIIFYVDDVPIREIVRNDAMGADFPSKPMSLYATIWDASDWATSGGKYRANYKYAPFVAEFTDLVLHGCATALLQEAVTADCTNTDYKQPEGADFANMTPKQKVAMRRFREKYIYYSYCYDTIRYPVPPPECVVDPVEKRLFKGTGRLKFDERHHHRRFKIRGQVMGVRKHENQEDVR
ncbi:putative xyloglucan endotransglucosylase/hydrolase protein 30-like [Dorcoceras hygrometricum]|uniref:Xyloglucan endotransglucosylase/hydrolase n=1 Tax=Dorcoceras hygrometricum TaxID=472368 RepID=A0A2Z7BDT9_9LAMI|nr:putative xyloglucan endotransglucosylase/hydrolase protein 30-like [Dorcoceras hygrometricum]